MVAKKTGYTASVVIMVMDEVSNKFENGVTSRHVDAAIMLNCLCKELVNRSCFIARRSTVV